MSIDAAPMTVTALRAIVAGVGLWWVAIAAVHFGGAGVFVVFLMPPAVVAGVTAMVAAMKAGTWPAMILFVLGVVLTLLSAIPVFSLVAF